MTGYCIKCRLFTLIERESELCVNCSNYLGSYSFTSNTTEDPNFFRTSKQLELEFPEES